MTIENDFPLFPLGIVALPTEMVPLHIFEEQYKEMIERCLRDGVEFDIVLADQDDSAPIGCAVEIADVLERMEDGRLNIVCRGTRPLRVVSLDDEREYPTGTVEFLADTAEEPDQSAEQAAREQYVELVQRATDDTLSEEQLADTTAYSMAARVDFGEEAKQGLLALRSENARLRLLTQLLRAVNKRLDQSELVAERARMNGKVRFD